MKKNIEKALLTIKFDTREEVLKKIENLLIANPGSLKLYGHLAGKPDIDIDIDIKNPTMKLVELPDCDCFYGTLTLSILETTN